MSDINWTMVATRFCGGLRDQDPPIERGFLTTPEHPDVTAIYVPDAEGDQLLKRLDSAGIEFLGKATHNDLGRRVVLVVVVRSTDKDRLAAIVGGDV